MPFLSTQTRAGGLNDSRCSCQQAGLVLLTDSSRCRKALCWCILPPACCLASRQRALTPCGHGAPAAAVRARLLVQLLLSGVSADEHLEGTIADPELLMEVSQPRATQARRWWKAGGTAGQRPCSKRTCLAAVWLPTARPGTRGPCWGCHLLVTAGGAVHLDKARGRLTSPALQL